MTHTHQPTAVATIANAAVIDYTKSLFAIQFGLFYRLLLSLSQSAAFSAMDDGCTTTMSASLTKP
jgi:hypothetical protein